MNKKYKITLPDGEERFLIQEDKPYIGAEYKTIITVEDEDFEFNGEYDEGDVMVEEIPMDYDEVQYQVRQDLKQINFGEQKDFELIKAEYPNYNRHICYEASMCAKIQIKEFSDLLEKYQNQESVLLKFSNNALHINEGKIDCEFQGNVDIKLNTKYLANVIKQINGNEFLLKTNGSKEKVLIQEVNNADKIYIVMPMN